MIEDFSFAEGDRIAIARSLVGGMSDSAGILAAYASVVDGEVVFDFGGGDTLTIESLSSIAGLENDVFLL